MSKLGAGDRRLRVHSLVLPFLLNVAIGLVCKVFLGAALGWTAEGRATLPDWLGDGLPFLQFMVVAYLVDRLFRVVSDQLTAMPRSGRRVPKLALQLVSALIYLSFLGASVGVVFHQSVGGVLAASGIAGLAVGLAVRGLLADIFSGIALNLDASLNSGDWIDVTLRKAQVSGRLLDIQWRTVVIADRSENLVFIPNSEFATATVVNHSQPQPYSEYAATVPVDVRHDRARVMRVLDSALTRAVGDGLLVAEPAPYVRVGSIADGMVSYRLFYCLVPARVSPARAQSQVLGYSLDFLKAAGLDLHPSRPMEMLPPHLPGQNRWTELSARLAVLADVPVLSVLSREELTQLAGESCALFLRQGEVILRAGAEGDSMVVVLEGSLAVQVDGEAGPVRVATLWPGECAGEMSLLTGAPRSATVVAASAACLLEVPKTALMPVLQANPALVERLAIAMEERLSMADGAGRVALPLQTRREDGSLVSRIRRFFRL